MDANIKRLLAERLLTTKELSLYTGLPEVTIKKRVERVRSTTLLKGRTYLFDRTDFAPDMGAVSTSATTELVR